MKTASNVDSIRTGEMQKALTIIEIAELLRDHADRAYCEALRMQVCIKYIKGYDGS